AQRPDSGREAGLQALVDDHHKAGVVADPALDDALDRDFVVAEYGRDPGEDAGAVGDLQVEVEGRGNVGDDRQLYPGLVHRRVARKDRDDVAEHRRSGLQTTGPRPRHRHLVDRRCLDHHRVERALDRRQWVAAIEEAGEDTDADAAVTPFGNAEQLQR